MTAIPTHDLTVAPGGSSFTIMRSQGGERQTKLLRCDGTVMDAEAALHFIALEKPIIGLRDIGDWLIGIGRNSRNVVVRGGLVNGLALLANSGPEC